MTQKMTRMWLLLIRRFNSSVGMRGTGKVRDKMDHMNVQRLNSTIKNRIIESIKTTG